MTLFLTVQSLGKAHGSKQLFKNLSFSIFSGDKIGLIGPNGAGKTSLLKIMAGLDDPDGGQVIKRQNLRVGYSCQSPEFNDHSLLDTLLMQEKDLDLESRTTLAKTLLSKAELLNPESLASKLSGGQKKRLDILCALMKQPDLLFLDEPTNHLDLEGIEWLENFLKRERLTYLLISHDRYFLENSCSKIIEINPCYEEGLFISDGGIEAFYEHKKTYLLGQQERQRSLKGTVKDEIDWLRRSPKARTTKSSARIQKAHALIDELQDVKVRNKQVRIDIGFQATERETRKLLAAKNIMKMMGDKLLFKGLDLELSPGSRVGLVGCNGSGKTTLLKILAGEIKQDMGTIKYTDDVKLVYFDQHREKIPMNITLKEALSPNGEMVDFHGRAIHVNGYAKRFLFYPDRLELPVSALSGGERARILIARLMLKPADILFLDEPTNDLDIDTLEVLEENLKEFPGAIVLITHDRCLMDTVCKEVIGLGVEESPKHFSDLVQYERYKASKVKPIFKEEKSPPVKVIKNNKKITYKEQKELEGMQEAILKVEDDIKKLEACLEKESSSNTKTLYEELGHCHKKLEALFERWQYLEDISK